jgi:hypothetical protein
MRAHDAVTGSRQTDGTNRMAEYFGPSDRTMCYAIGLMGKLQRMGVGYGVT